MKKIWSSHKAVLLVLMLLLSGPVLASASKPNLYHQGLELGLANRLGEAAKTLARITVSDPAYYDAMILRKVVHAVKDKSISRKSGLFMFSAMQHVIDDKFDLAGPDVAKAVTLAPKCAWAYDIRAIVERHRHKEDDAMSDFAKALELDPKDIVALGNRGIILQNRRKFDAAIAEYDKSLAIAPNQPRTYYNRGWVYDHKNDEDKAMADYTKAVTLDSRYENAYVARAAIYMNRGELKKALQDYHKAEAIDPNDGWIYEGLGVLYLGHRKDVDKGCGYLEKACKLGKCWIYSHTLQDRNCPLDPTAQAILDAWHRANSLERRKH